MARLTTEQQVSQFRKGIRMLMGQWTVTQLILEHEMAGDHTASMVDDLVQNLIVWFEDDGVEEDGQQQGAYEELTVDEVSSYVIDVLTEDMGIDIEDPSIREMAQLLLQVKAECADGNFERVQALERNVQETSNTSVEGASSSGVVYRGDYSASAQKNARRSKLSAIAHRMADLLSDDDEEIGSDEDGSDDDNGEEDGDGWTTVGKKSQQ